MSDRLTPYLGNVLTNFENGAQLDLRVKLAVDFLKSPWAAEMAVATDSQTELAVAALDLACALVEEAQARGLLHALPEDGSVNSPLRKHIERSVRAQVFQQIAGARIAQEEAPAVVPAGPLNGVGRVMKQ
jgi:hypothetical protein